MLKLVLIFALVFMASGSQHLWSADAGAANGNASTNSNLQTYQVKGLVLEVNPAEKSLKIKHEAIPGYMMAMTMDFDVKDTNELSGIEAGDPVTFRMLVNDTYGWIDQIQKTGPKQNNLPSTAASRPVREVETLNEGDLLPEYQFTNQFGRLFSTSHFKGEALAINFLFTRCPYPTFCPLTAEHFAEAQRKLLAMVNGPTNWHLLTISFDPEYDKPPVLKAYAEHYGYDSNRWTFATGELMDIKALGDQFGLTFWHDETGSFNHNLRTVVVDSSGHVSEVLIGNTWTPDELVTAMIEAAKTRLPK